MVKWKINDKIFSNKLSEISKISVLVEIKYLNKLKEFNIPYIEFSDKAKDCYFVRVGAKPKRFNLNKVNQIKKDNENGLSYRKLAEKYNCSTSTIYEILKDKY